MVLILTSSLIHAENLNIAVAANFKHTLEALKQDFEKSSPHTLKIISASTGQLVQQISQHAPFDILLAATLLTLSCYGNTYTNRATSV